MSKEPNTSKVDIPERVVTRMRVDISPVSIEKLRAYAATKNRTMAEVIEILINTLD